MDEGKTLLGRGGDSVRRAVLVQFSDLLLTCDSTMRDYYRKSYRRMRGYYMPTHFFEVPYWIPIVSSMLPDDRFQKELVIVDDLDRAARMMAAADADDLFFFSAMDANIQQLRQLARVGATMVVGGYTDPADLAPFPNVHFEGAVDDLPLLVPGAISRGRLDYRLFRGLQCIPRFSLSTGCSFRCKFCTVPTKLTLADPALLQDEVAALEPLDFRLVFVDDKSFGDAPNWRTLGQVGEWISGPEPGIRGLHRPDSPVDRGARRVSGELPGYGRAVR